MRGKMTAVVVGRVLVLVFSFTLTSCWGDKSNDDTEPPVDEDQDGVFSEQDCDDLNPDLGSQTEDRDCDGVLTVDDCDDDNPIAWVAEGPAVDELIGDDGIDNFCQNYCSRAVTGDVIFQWTERSDLDPLSCLTSIGGTLDLYGVGLTQLDGLSNLTTIGGGLIIWGNMGLTELDGLSGLRSVGGEADAHDGQGSYSVAIHVNPNLANLDGLYNLTSIAGGLQVLGNDDLISIDGLFNLSSVSGDLMITHNEQLCQEDVDSLTEGIEVGGDTDISDNDDSC